MAGRKKKGRAAFNPMSMSFLDVMSCGFGAAILLFLILDPTSTERGGQMESVGSGEVSLLEQEIVEGREDLLQVRNTVDRISLEVVDAQGLADRIQRDVSDFLAQLAALEGNTLASEESLEALRADIEALEADILNLQTSAIEEQGDASRAFLGEGDRQYLTGMFLGGNRIVILLDASASMLDDTLVNIIRIRNMSAEAQRAAPKWQRAVRIVDWISSQLPVASQYQIYAFNESPAAALQGTDGVWLEVADQDELNEVVGAVRSMTPGGGGNLQAAFRAVAQMVPPPDNVYLITDGLPTQGARAARGSTITPRERLQLFWQAVDELPRNLPVNTILLPLEGDPAAAAVFWQLGVETGGSFITPSRDWP